MAKQATRQVSIFLNGKEVENSIKAIAAEQKKANNELARMIVGSEEYVKKAAEVRRLNTILDDHRKGLRNVEQGWSLMQAGMDKFVGIAAGAFTVDAVIGFGKELFNTAVEMEAMEKKARIVFGEALPQIQKEAEKSATAMGLTTAQYVAQAAAIQDILVPMGFQRKQAAEISGQLVNLSGALSEWTGGQVTAKQVTEILSSALTGEREQLKQLGIVLSQADIDARVAEKGMSKLEGTLKQQAEAAASLELILEKSLDAQTAYANNAGDMSRRTAELTARFEEVKERLSTALVPVFEAVVTVMEDAGDAFSSFVSLLEDPKWGDSLKKALTPLLGIGGGGLITRIFGTKKEVEDVSAQIAQLQAETDALLVQYGVKDGGKPANTKGPKELEAERKAAEDAAKKAKAEFERSLKELNTLIERTTEARLDFIAKATDDEVTIAIRGVEKKYDAEIAKALELEKKGFEQAKAQRIILEQLKAEEISLITDQYYAKEFEAFQENEKKKQEEELRAYQETLKFLDEKREERKQKELEIKDFERAGLLTDRENELLELEEHYKTLLDYATKNGIDTVALMASFEAQKTEMAKQGSKEREDVERQVLDNYAALQIERANAVAQGAAILGQFFEESSSVGKAFFLLEKAAAAVSVVLSLQKEKAAIFAAARLGTLFDPTGAAALALATPQIVAANIRAGINLATIAATAIKPFVKQKFMGGYHDGVTGATDGRTYYPSYIGSPNTGLLPGHSPVLMRSGVNGQPILANERGREYFVSHRDLQNPVVANYVGLIDSIVNSGFRVRQFADGGFNDATAQTNTAQATDNQLLKDVAKMMALNNQLLTYLIQNGVLAVVPDGTLIDMNDRMKTLQKISGGYY